MPQSSADPAPVFPPLEEAALVQEPEAAQPRVLKLKVTDDRLVPYVQSSIEMFRASLGLNIEIHDSGVPVGIQPEVRYKGAIVDGIAHHDRPCSFDECRAEETFIVVGEALLGDKQWAMQHTMNHEIGHILSGWGKPAGMSMHLEVGNLMGPGCRNRQCWALTELDATLICAGSPCEWLALD